MRRLKRILSGRTVLEVEELKIAAGEVTVLQGPNGAGKTLLIKILALLDRPQEGDLSYLGTPVGSEGRTALRREITLAAQDPYLFHGSVERNLGYGLGARGVPRPKRRSAVEQALAAVGLSGFGTRTARKLSVGEQRRVALARALVLKPRALLLDEPFAGLDAESALVFEQVIKDLPGLGTTVILVSHSRDQALRLASRIITLENGCVTGDWQV